MIQNTSLQSAAGGVDAHQPPTLIPGLYRFHTFRVQDSAGQQVGVADWIWADADTGQGAFVGIRQSWLLGTAQAIPARGAHIDLQTRTLRLAYTAEQIKRAGRFAICRALRADQERAVWAH